MNIEQLNLSVKAELRAIVVVYKDSCFPQNTST